MKMLFHVHWGPSMITKLQAASLSYCLLSNGFFTQNACMSEHCHNNEIKVFMKLFLHAQWGPSMMSQGKITKLHAASSPCEETPYTVLHMFRQVLFGAGNIILYYSKASFYAIIVS